MYVSPNHPDRERLTARPKEPAESGRRLATFDRGTEQFRIVLSEFRGFPFVSLRVWAPGPDGSMLPVKGKGCSIRMGEVEELGRVLTALAVDETQPDRPVPPREPLPSYGADLRTPDRRWGKNGLPDPSEGGAKFDEFAG